MSSHSNRAMSSDSNALSDSNSVASSHLNPAVSHPAVSRSNPVASPDLDPFTSSYSNHAVSSHSNVLSHSNPAAPSDLGPVVSSYLNPVTLPNLNPVTPSYLEVNSNPAVSVSSHSNVLSHSNPVTLSHLNPVTSSFSNPVIASHSNLAVPSGPTLPSNPHLQTLVPLIQYTTSQEERIGRLSTRFRNLEKDDGFVALWEEVWGKSDLPLYTKEKVERGLISSRVEDALIDGIVPDECDIMVPPSSVFGCWDLGCERVFIRPGEYEETEKAALAASQQPRCHGFLITGQPGIGLSLFPFITAELQNLSVFIREIYISASNLLTPPRP